MAQSTVKVKIQKFGNFLSSMVLPNIGAFIAWGLITALFIPDGLIPNESLASLVGPMVTYLLPLLIGYTGGKLIHDQRGGVVGAIATMGVIVGAPDTPMFLGAMIMGPLGAYVIKKFDQLIDGKIRSGFEMLVNNFSAGILGGILAILAFLGIGPAVNAFTQVLVHGVDWLIAAHLLPLTSILIEPAKILFLNNAINHGILSPIGLEQVQQTGKSVLFLLEANPGPGLGVLLAYMFFSRGTAKQSAPGAAIIHFFGGIHEIYFPYVLMKPALLLSVILGGMSGVLTLVLLGGGLASPASPGSVIAIGLVTPTGDVGAYIANFAAIIVAAIVSFLVSAIILKSSKKDDGNIEDATKKMEDMKGKKSSVAGHFNQQSNGQLPENVNKIIFACDAGMGSSAMGASLLRKKVKEAGIEGVTVTNTAISNLPADAQVVITQEELTPRAQSKLPSAYHISVDNFLSSPEYDKLIGSLQADVTPAQEELVEEAEAPVDAPDSGDDDLLLEENIFLNQSFATKEEAIRFAGEALAKAGYVEDSYVDAMIDREGITTTYMGNNVAIPHGTEEAKRAVLKSGFTIIQVPEGVDFNGEKAKLIFGIAGKDGTHLEILSSIAVICSEQENVDKMVLASSAKEIKDIINSN
ncbi:PTS mannitol transporter subunit IICBA [Rossellomorea marisflavi]|uniref:PTS mannitol transporter subunit IICBA n=1 Tax=Rossellomorea marisflavi TaxID=189381 RepID=UPI001EE24CCF|nr:PTS mannitol transporter subunit IICBA [Rossellomorea marisflavi]MDW4525681.1 PTS mannitol transporter subunit IICBA [Rossellomorea marisflavi]UKS66375.1 PTS mannitol transporter subunit IICBA [Rossellomorea marisflavi]WJV17890.1 PTS mannitol transporter subunit IICBA [Rossellomorea marisflavi]